jgi:hypothetical protein
MIHRTRTLGFLLALLASGVGVALANSEARLRAWAPLVRLTTGQGPEGRDLAVTRIRSGLATLHSVLYGLQVDEPTRAFFVKVLTQLESFDLASLYETLPESGQDGWRSVRFAGDAGDGKYTVARVDDGLAASLDPEAARFGDLRVAFRSRPANGGTDNFVGNGHVEIGAGAVSWFQVLGAFAETIRLVESAAPGSPRAEGMRPSAEALAQVKRDNPKLGPEDLELVAVFRESFPRVYDHLRELYRTDDVLVYDPDQEDWKQVHLVLSLRQDAAEQKYPAIWKWLTGLGPLASGRLEITDEQNRVVATMRFSSKDLGVTLDAFLAHGKICPVENGRVLVNEGIDPETTTRAHHRDRWSMDFDVNGIVTEVRDLAFKVDYEKTREGMRARIVCDEEPKVRVHGSAFGLIPTWAIDIVLPGNMEELTKSFLRVMTRGNDGKGVVIELSERRGASGGNVATADMTAEGLNNFLVRLGFKIARRKIIPSDDAVDEIAAFLRGGHDAFVSDLDAFAAAK